MRVVFFGLATILLFAAQGTPAAGATKVFLMAGQSNMAGVGGYSGYLSGAPWTTYPYGQGPDAPCPAPYSTPNSAVQFWNYTADLNPTGVEIQPGVGDGWVDLQLGYGALKFRGPQFGPELSFGARLKQLYPNDDIYLVKYALSSTSLAGNWNPSGTNNCYTALKARVSAALTNLTTAGKNPEVAGMIWMQGEDDATDYYRARDYQTNLKNFVTKVRDYVKDYVKEEVMPFVAGRITYIAQYWAPAAYSTTVRNAQWNIAGFLDNASCIDTDDLQWAYYGHYGTQGQIDLGNRFADEFTPAPEPSTLFLAGIGLLLAMPRLLRATPLPALRLRESASRVSATIFRTARASASKSAQPGRQTGRRTPV